MNRNNYSGIRKQIFIFTMAMIFICTLFIGIFFFIISQSVLRKNQTSSALSALSHGAYTVKEDLDNLQELMDYFFVDQQIQSILAQDIQTSYDLTLQENQLRYALSTYERLDFFRYINCIIFYNSQRHAHTFPYMAMNGSSYLKRCQDLGWYEDALREEGRLVWENQESDYMLMEGRDISAIRALRDSSYKTIQGAVYVSIQPAFFSVLQKNNGLSNITVYLYDNTGRLLNPHGSQDIFSASSLLEDTPWQTENYRFLADQGNFIYEYKIPSYGYRLIALQPIAGTFSMDQNILILAVVMVAMMLLVAVSLWVFLTRRVIRPVHMLANTMKQVHTGDLSVRASQGINGEFGYLARQLNQMLDQIQSLMKKNLEKERAVQEAEHNAVLAQLNPHFVYNALFAIRMMAVIQKADNIQDMVNALWRMLKNSTSRAKQDFRLADEIQNVKDYLHILSASNVQKFDVVYDIEPGLEEILCPKFLIQPVVENAIVHGVLPKAGFSTITIVIRSQDALVNIQVSNDGLPISQDRLSEVNDSLSNESSAHKGLGLSSIRRRLKLLYGDQADLTITSTQVPEKTTVTILFPFQKGENSCTGQSL